MERCHNLILSCEISAKVTYPLTIPEAHTEKPASSPQKLLLTTTHANAFHPFGAFQKKMRDSNAYPSLNNRR
jgi:hypothetical protein